MENRFVNFPFERLNRCRKIIAILLESDEPPGTSEVRAKLGIDPADEKACRILVVTLNHLARSGEIQRVPLPKPG